MKWISVKDSLPEDDNFVLAYLDSCIEICFFEEGVWRDREWIDHEVSHWMPLPPMPNHYEDKVAMMEEE